MSTGNVYRGGSILLFGNTNSYIDIGNDIDIRFGTGDFTIEWFQYQTDSNVYPRVFSIGHNAPPTRPSFAVSLESNTFYAWLGGAPAINMGSITDYKNHWEHFALTRQNGNLRAFRNGTLLSSGTIANTSNLNNTTNVLRIGNESVLYPNSAFGGYLTNFHWVKGLAKYTNNFTAPTAPLTIESGEETKLLLKAVSPATLLGDSGESINVKTITNQGTQGVVWSSLSPFEDSILDISNIPITLNRLSLTKAYLENDNIIPDLDKFTISDEILTGIVGVIEESLKASAGKRIVDDETGNPIIQNICGYDLITKSEIQSNIIGELSANTIQGIANQLTRVYGRNTTFPFQLEDQYVFIHTIKPSTIRLYLPDILSSKNDIVFFKKTTAGGLEFTISDDISQETLEGNELIYTSDQLNGPYYLDLSGDGFPVKMSFIIKDAFIIGTMSLTTLNVSDYLSVSGDVFIDGGTLDLCEGDIINVSNLRFADGSVISSGSSLTISGNTYFNNQVGIGTTSPGFPLEVSGNTQITGILSLTGGDLSMGLRDIINVSNIRFADGTTLSTATGGGGGGGSFVVEEDFQVNHYDIIEVSNLRFSDGPAILGATNTLTISGDTTFDDYVYLNGGYNELGGTFQVANAGTIGFEGNNVRIAASSGNLTGVDSATIENSVLIGLGAQTEISDVIVINPFIGFPITATKSGMYVIPVNNITGDTAPGSRNILTYNSATAEIAEDGLITHDGTNTTLNTQYMTTTAIEHTLDCNVNIYGATHTLSGSMIVNENGQLNFTDDNVRIGGGIAGADVLYSVAIGTGSTANISNSIVLNAVDTQGLASTKQGFYVSPIVDSTDTPAGTLNVLMYDPDKMITEVRNIQYDGTTTSLSGNVAIVDGELDMGLGDIVDVSNIRFGDGSVISSGSSLTISGNTIFNNSLGISTTDLDNPLNVKGVIQLQNYNTGNEKYGIYSWDNKLQINPRTSTGSYRSIDAIIMDSSGRVGIGQGTPTKTLDLNGTFNMTNGARTGTHTTTYPFYATADIGAESSGFQFGHLNGTTGVGIGYTGMYMAGSTTNLPMTLTSKGTGEIVIKPGGTTRATFTSTGLGIGTTAPGNQLHIVKSSNFPELAVHYSPGGQIGIFGCGSAGVYIGYSGYLTIGTTTGTQIAGFSDLFRFTSTGRLGIGTGSPATQLQLTLDSASKPSTNTWTIASDKRLKENIVDADLSRCYEIVKNLPLKHYKWKDEYYTHEQVKDRSKLGWIANEVELYFPKGVDTISEWIYKDEVKDSSQNIIEEAKKIIDLKTLNSDQIYAVMYGAIQQLISNTEELNQIQESHDEILAEVIQSKIHRGKTTLESSTKTLNLDTFFGFPVGTFQSMRNLQVFLQNHQGWSRVKGTISGSDLTIIAQDPDCNDEIDFMIVADETA